MQYVIRATDRFTSLGWLLPSETDGRQRLGSLAAAERFESWDAALHATLGMPRIFREVGIRYGIEEDQLPAHN